MNKDVVKFKDALTVRMPDIYFYPSKNAYMVMDSNNEWIQLNESSYKRILKSKGVSSKTKAGDRISPVDAEILKVQQEKNIHYAGPVAGYSSGLQTFGGTRVLVTSSPKIIPAKEGDWDVLQKLTVGLLGEDQIQYFYGWLKIAYEALLEGTLRPGQVVAFCGPHKCGKSLLQNIVTEVLGGRVARPYQLMRGDTAFNADIMGSEHLVLEDEQPSTDIRARRTFGAAIKNVTVNEVQRLHSKGKDAITLRPFWRLTVSLNDEEENLQVLPPLDDSLEDKIMIFRTSRTDMPMPTKTILERTEFWNALMKAIPGFLHHLVNWDIPKDLQCERFGIRHYHDPSILHALSTLSPEARLLELIDLAFFSDSESVNQKPIQFIELTATEIQKLLESQDLGVSYEARSLLKWHGACGTYLGRLSKSRPDRVTHVRTANKRLWKITRPPDE